MGERLIKIGLLGSGTVGKGIQDIVFGDGENLTKRLGYRLEIEKIYTRFPREKY